MEKVDDGKVCDGYGNKSGEVESEVVEVESEVDELECKVDEMECKEVNEMECNEVDLEQTAKQTAKQTTEQIADQSTEQTAEQTLLQPVNDPMDVDSDQIDTLPIEPSAPVFSEPAVLQQPVNRLLVSHLMNPSESSPENSLSATDTSNSPYELFQESRCCYVCNGQYVLYESINCYKCPRFIHFACSPRYSAVIPLCGDDYYKYSCGQCSTDPESLFRPVLTIVDIVYLKLFDALSKQDKYSSIFPENSPQIR